MSSVSQIDRSGLSFDDFKLHRADRRKIMQIFNSELEPTKDNCFKMVLEAYQNGRNWKQIAQITDLVGRLRNSEGRDIYEVLQETVDNNNLPPNFYENPPENIFYQGGGVKGIAYIGVKKALEEMKIDPDRVAGTSAGAILATFHAIGCNFEKLEEFLTEKSLTDFRDFPSFEGGLFKGEEFREWFERKIAEVTKIKYCTFGELARLREGDKTFKHLHVFATQVKPKREIIRFSSEDKKWKNLIMSDAGRASMSLPFFYQPHILHFKNPETGEREPREEYGSFEDGGIAGANLYVEAFDRKRYIEKKPIPKEERNCPIFNKRTLAFSLCSPDVHVTSLPEVVFRSILPEAVFLFCKARYSTEKRIRNMNSYNEHRIVKINNMGIGTMQLELEENQIKQLIESGYKSTMEFFEKQEEPPPLKYVFSNKEDSDTDEEDYVFYNKLTSKEEKELFYYGPKATAAFMVANTVIVGTSILAGALTFGTAALPVMDKCTKKLCSERFILLAMDDSRFDLFKYLSENESEKVEMEWAKHEDFYLTLSRSKSFQHLLLDTENEKFISFFKEKKLLKIEKYSASIVKAIGHQYRNGQFVIELA